MMQVVIARLLRITIGWKDRRERQRVKVKFKDRFEDSMFRPSKVEEGALS